MPTRERGKTSRKRTRDATCLTQLKFPNAFESGYIVAPMSKLGRNDPCHCGSGQKYKKCHLVQDETAKSAELAAAAEAAKQRATETTEAGAATEVSEPAAGKPQGGPVAPPPRPHAPAARPKIPAPTPAPAFRRKSV